MTQWINQGVGVSITVGPFVIATDGVTPVTDVVASDLDVFEVLKHGSTATIALDSNDVFGPILGADGWYHLTLDSDDTDTLGMLTIAAQDTSRHLPVVKDFMVVSGVQYGGLISATDNLQVHAVEYASNADNLAASDIWDYATRILTANTNLNDIAASDVQAELVTYAAVKSTDAAWASDIAALNDPTAAAIADAVWDELTTDHLVAGSMGNTFDSNGRIDVNVVSISAQAADAYIANSVWDALTTDHTDAGSFGLNLDAQMTSRSSHAATDVTASVSTDDMAGIADHVWDEVTTDHVAAGSFGLNLDAQVSGTIASPASDVWAFGTRTLTTPTTDFQADLSTLNDPTAATIADAVWNEATTDHISAGSFGLNLDAQVSGIPTSNLAASDIQAELVTYDALKGTEGAWASDVAALNNPSSTDIALAIWNTPSTDHTVSATFGAYLDAAISGIPTSNLVASDIQAELVTYAGLKSTDGAWASDIAALNNLADSDILEDTLETGYTVAQALQLIAAASAAKSSGGGTSTIVFRDLADGANRISATVDTDGNRTAVTHTV